MQIDVCYFELAISLTRTAGCVVAWRVVRKFFCVRIASVEGMPWIISREVNVQLRDSLDMAAIV